MTSSNQRVLKITYRGVDYRWSPTAGFTRASGMSAPAALKPILEAQIEARLNAEDAAIDDPALLTERSIEARRLRQLSRSEKLARLITSGRIHPEKLITHTFHGLEGVEPALMMMKDKPKDLIKPLVLID